MKAEYWQRWEELDAELLKEEETLAGMKEHLAHLDEVEAEDILQGWYRDVAQIKE